MTKGPDGNVYVRLQRQQQDHEVPSRRNLPLHPRARRTRVCRPHGPALPHRRRLVRVLGHFRPRFSLQRFVVCARARDLNVSTANLSIPAGMLFRDNGQLLVAAYGNGAVRRATRPTHNPTLSAPTSAIPAGLWHSVGLLVMLYTPDRASILACAGTNAIRKYNANTGQFQSLFCLRRRTHRPHRHGLAPRRRSAGFQLLFQSGAQVHRHRSVRVAWSTGGDLATPYELLLIPTPATLGLLAPLAFMRRRSRAT